MSATLIQRADEALAKYAAIYPAEPLGMEADLAAAARALRGRVLELEDTYGGMRTRQEVERELRQMESLDDAFHAVGPEAFAAAAHLKRVLRWTLGG